jgi:hypothetical protein
MKNNNKDNSLLPLYRQDTKKGKELRKEGTLLATHHPPSPHRRRPAPHRRRHQKHEQDQYGRQTTRQEPARHKGQGQAGRQVCRETPGVARPAGCG